MTKRERILNYLKENGLDIENGYKYEEKDKWQKPGTIVINTHSLTQKDREILWRLDAMRFDESCPIEIHSIRYHFEWLYGYKRIFLKKKY